MTNAREHFKCPRCGHPQTCPCANCQDRWPSKKPWIWIDGESIQCGGCGFTEFADWWENQSIEQFLASQHVSSLSEAVAALKEEKK